MTIVVNLVGGPCCGKSTTAAGLFSIMKLQTDKKVEIVTEVIKDYVYDENKGAMTDQVLITAQQNHRLRRLDGKVDFIVSDASLLNAVVYNEFYHDIENLSTELSKKLFALYDNEVFLLPRKPQYDQYGRTQTLEEAKHLDTLFKMNLQKLGVPFHDMTHYTHEEMPEAILKVLLG
jgi:ABC-type dipeptide/oligopeptide/nickel transport system ATPase component